MFTKTIASLLAFLIGILQSFGIGIKPVDFTPAMEITGQFACTDENPEIEISVKKTSFRFIVSKDSIFLNGAFRGLEIKSVTREDCRTLLIETEGKLDDDYSVGYVVLSDNATKSGSSLQAETEIDMSFKDPGIIGGDTPSVIENFAKKQAKSLIVKGIKKIPYVGNIAASLLDSKINEVLGIKASPSIGDVLNKLDEISEQLNGISALIEQTNQEVMKKLYAMDNFGTVNQLATRLGRETSTFYQNLSVIDEAYAGASGDTALYEYIKAIRIASLLDFDMQNTSDMVTNTNLLSTYVSGSQVSVSDEENIFVKAFEYACRDCVFGGEAAMIVAPYVNEISNICAHSYKAIAIVLAAKLYVCDHYNEIAAMEESSAELKNALSTLPNRGFYDKQNNPASYKYWEQLASVKKGDEDKSLVLKHNELFSDENPLSLANVYNQMVRDRWFSFIRKAEVSSSGIDIEFVNLSSNIGSAMPMELGIDVEKSDELTRSMVDKVDKAYQSKMFKCVSEDEIKVIIEHILKNSNKVFVEKEETDGIHVTRNLIKILEDFGFAFPESKSGKLIFTDNSSSSYKSQLISAYTASHDYSASLTVNGFDCIRDVEYYTNLDCSSDLKWENTKYYNHSCSTANGSVYNVKTTVEDCTFFYFAPAPIILKTPEEFVDFITSVSKGNTYEQETVSLETDINFSKDEYKNIWPENMYESCFKGTFNGNMSIIANLSDNTANNGGGLFRSLGDGAAVNDLIFDDISINGAAGKSGFGAVAGRVTGNATIKGIFVRSGFITGGDKVGGIAGEVTNGSLVIKDCENSASVYSNGKYAGGILGASTSKKSQSISLCTNKANITANNGSGTGGIVGYLANDSADQPHTIISCTNKGVVESTGGNTGGIIGHLDTDSTSNEIIYNNNCGRIDAPTGNAGGIVGYSEGGGKFTQNKNSGNVTGNHAGGILGFNEDDSIIFDESENSGKIYASVNAGGIAGYLGNNSNDKSYVARNCKNSGVINAENGAAGGIIGHLDTDGTKQNISGNENSGEVTSKSSHAGGIVAYSEGGGDFTNNINTAAVTGKTAGGVIGWNEDDAITFSGSVNSGKISAVSEAGGILGYTGSKDLDHTYTFNNCSNSGSVVSSKSYAGGIAGNVDSDSMKHSFENCQNNEAICGSISTGGIIGRLGGGGTFSSCVNNNSITSETSCAGGIAGYVVDDACTFTECRNEGEIKGAKSCGGIAGEAGSKSEDDAFTFKSCTNNGNVTSSSLNAGGIIGMLQTDNKNHSFISCKNIGSVNGKTGAGGIIGFMYGGGQIYDCENSAAISASDSYAGGMIGRIEDDKCTFTNCSNTGAVTAPNYFGNTCGYDGRTKTTF